MENTRKHSEENHEMDLTPGVAGNISTPPQGHHKVQALHDKIEDDRDVEDDEEKNDDEGTHHTDWGDVDPQPPSPLDPSVPGSAV